MRHYDVIVLGGNLASLFCGAVLAKRGFRILLIGHDYLSPTYTVGEYRLPRLPFTFIGARSPITNRLLSELRLTQPLRRLVSFPNPAFQFVLPGHRLDFFRDNAGLEKEIEREFPKVKRPIEDFHRNTTRISKQLDSVLEKDLVWPPASFWERREFARACARHQSERAGQMHDLLAEFPEDHPFRLAVHFPAYFSDGIGPDEITALRLSRHYVNWRQGSLAIEGGLTALHQLLLDKIRSHSGAIQLNARAGSILVQRGVACGIRLDGSDDEIGSNFVVAGIELSDLLDLLPERAEFEELFERVGEPQRSHYRYALNLVVAAPGFPDAMKQNLFYLRNKRGPNTAENVLLIQSERIDNRRFRISLQALLPRRQIEDVEGYIDTVRESLLESLRELLPFLDDHLLLVDSPNDGCVPRVDRGEGSTPVEESWKRGPKTMSCTYAYPVTSALGLCAVPIYTPVRKLLLCNAQVAPGLGMEGLLLTAWSTARLITRSDPSKERMCKGLWTKVEI
ncbi:MAG: hypothetical protein JXA30_02315 [Deltaproteobacteria bacterium]|nr:hypothetical protein [Deltaproteobacteria bacterium]